MNLNDNTNEPIIWTPHALAALRCDAGQQAAIDTERAETRTDEAVCEYAWSDRVVYRDGQAFALYGLQALELLRFAATTHGGTRYEYQPVLIGGRLRARFPREGDNGIMHLMRRTHRRGEPAPRPWIIVYVKAGWLHAHEIGMTNEQIRDRINDEITSGANVLTRAPAGWA